MDYFQIIKPLLYALPPEVAHNLATKCLKYKLLPKRNFIPNPNLISEVMGLKFPHPLGLAAGFDKNAECIASLFEQGFSFIETGTVTPRPQLGNPKPRMFRLTKDQAIINRLGFNNKGIDYFITQLSKYKETGIVGVNIGKNKDTEDFLEDYIFLLRKVFVYASYITLNVSSPNTPGLRDLQQYSNLQLLLSEVMKLHQELSLTHQKDVSVLLKIAPDLNENDLENIAELALAEKIHGIIISNTTITRDFDFKNIYLKKHTGGLSGKPLFSLSTNVLRKMYKLIRNKIPLIGVGGIFSGHDAYLKILSGASLVQIYSSLIFNGFSIIPIINQELSLYLERDGFNNISEAIGQDVR